MLKLRFCFLVLLALRLNADPAAIDDLLQNARRYSINSKHCSLGCHVLYDSNQVSLHHASLGGDGVTFVHADEPEKRIHRRKYIFVVDTDGKIFFTPHNAQTKSVHHCSFCKVQAIAAGEIRIYSDKIVINNKSGHFHPTKESLFLFRDLLLLMGYKGEIKVEPFLPYS